MYQIYNSFYELKKIAVDISKGGIVEKKLKDYM